MSALPPKADIDRACQDVRFVPEADITGLFDHLVGERKHIVRYREIHRLCGFHIDDE